MLVPLFVKLENRVVLVVGGGPVGERKVDELHAAGARVVLVAPEVTPALASLSERAAIVWHARPFEPGDVQEAWLVVAATDDHAVQRTIRRVAEHARVFCIAVDDPENATAYSASVLRRAPLTVAIASDGALPALVRLMREVLEAALPEREWIEAAEALRRRWKAEAVPMGSRFAELVRAFARTAPR